MSGHHLKVNNVQLCMVMNNPEQHINSSTQTTPRKSAENTAAFIHIVEQYTTDAAFLWMLRSDAVKSTLYSKDDVSELDMRINGLLDGLQASDELAWEVCQQQLDFEEAGETFVAAMYAFQSGDAGKIQLVCEKGLGNAEMRRGLISAMGWVEPAIAHFWIERFLGVIDPRYRYLGLAACSVRRHDPRHLLTHLITDKKIMEQPEVHARALRLIGELKRQDLTPALNQAMELEDEGIKFWAHWSAIILGNRACVERLKPYVMKDNAYKERALMLVFNVLPVMDARKWISEISSDLKQNRNIISTTAILGDPHAIGWLIQQMQKPLYARVAGLSFNLITGIDLEQTDLHKVVANPLPDSEDDDFEDPAENIDGDLPWPDPLLVRAFWDQHGHALQIGQRYFMGQPVNSASLKQVLATGNQFQRHAAALKLVLLDPAEALLNTASPNIQ